MCEPELYAGGDLIVFRQLISPTLADDMQTEWLERLAPVIARNSPPFIDEPIHCLKTAWVDTLLGDEALAATNQVIKILGRASLGNSAITVNYQPPAVKQHFHMDAKNLDDTVLILHCGADGAMDYAPGESNLRRVQSEHLTVKNLGAGDAVLQRGQQPYRLHRGRNNGSGPRITAAFARQPIKPLAFTQ